MKTPLVLVLGCGPAGLIAAQAAEREFGFNVQIVSKKRVSQLYGCQYLHEPIPGIDAGPRKLVKYGLQGTLEQYAAKVYGADATRLPSPVSPQLFQGGQYAWDIREAYRLLWQKFSTRIEDQVIEITELPAMVDHYKPAFVISTIPSTFLCINWEHEFKSTPCWAIGDAPELGQYAPTVVPPFTVMCDGTDEQGFYRAANVFGHATVEWPGWRRRPPLDNVVEFYKPLSTTCDCAPWIHRVGRMGLWRKGILSHHAYSDTANHIRQGLAKPGPLNIAEVQQ